MAIQVVKSMKHIACPHCEGKIVVAFHSAMPDISWSLKAEDIAAIKKSVIDEVSEIVFKDPSVKEGVLAQLASDEIMFGPEEKASVIDQIKRDYAK